MSSSSLCFSPPRRKLTQPLTEANLDVVCGLLDLYMSRIFMVLFCFGKGNTGNPPPPKKKEMFGLYEMWMEHAKRNYT